MKDVIKKVIIGILSSSIPFTLLSCSLDKTPLGQRTFLNSSKIIEGKVEFPEKSFNVKATLGEVSPNATVSVIYPPDHPTSPNKTIATGLTNDTGVFSINIDSTFTPANGEIFIIEAEKRMGGVNRDVLTISSYIQFDSASNTWKSMTSPDITINKTTTALSIIASLNTDILNAKETIGKIDISTGSSVPMNIYNTNIYFTSNQNSNNEIYSMSSNGTMTNLTNNSANDDFASLSPNSKKIAFVSNRDGNNEIYTMNIDGTELTRLTSNAFDDSKPSWSPDGSKIAFTSNRDGDNNIYVMDSLTGNNPSKLTSDVNNDDSATWSPDGLKIAFTSNRDANNNNIYVMDSTGSNQTQLTSVANDDNSPTWSPNGNLIAFVSNRDGNNEIYTMNIDGTQQTNFTNSSSSNETSPKWIENVSDVPTLSVPLLLFTSDNDGTNDIYSMNATNIIKLTKNTESNFNPTNIPTKVKSQTILEVANLVAYVLERNYDPAQYISYKNNKYIVSDPMKVSFMKKIVLSSNDDLFSVNEDGTNQTTLISSPYNENNPVWSPDGSKIAFDSLNKIFIKDSTSIRMVTKTDLTETNPVWSPDSKKFAFVSDREGNSEIYTMNVDGTELTRLTNNSADDKNPSWSPDGKKIVFSSNRENSLFQLYTMNFDGTLQTKFSSSSFNDTVPKWSTDGSKIAFVSDRDSNSEIYTVNSDGTNLLNISNNVNSDTQPCWSPNSSKIAFISDRDAGVDKIFIMNADGTSQSKLLDLQTSALDWK